MGHLTNPIIYNRSTDYCNYEPMKTNDNETVLRHNMQTIVVATANLSKLRELKAILAELNVDLRPQSEWGITSAEENRLSFVENSLIKARHASAATGLPALADDSGLLVDVLGGAPGIRSARYAGRNASDKDNVKRLLKELAEYDCETFAAHFHCAATYVRSAEDPLPIISEADWHGHIIRMPKGQTGFGYDPIFYLPELNSTAAELSAETKNRLSHRNLAFKKLCAALRIINKAE